MENSILYEVSSKMMNNLTKDCLWYFDTPEERFELSPESIWLINPDTEEWVLELEKDESLWYYYNIYHSFKKYFNMERSDFESFIKLWVEDALKRGLSTTAHPAAMEHAPVEDALKRGVSTTHRDVSRPDGRVEDALKRGVSTTHRDVSRPDGRVEDALKRGVSTTPVGAGCGGRRVEDALKRGVSTTMSVKRR